MLVDDHEMVRSSFAALLADTDDIVVVAQAGTLAEAIEQARAHRPEVVVMDMRLGIESGVDATRAIKEVLPETHVVILTGSNDRPLLAKAISAGASSYVLKGVDPDLVVEAIRAAARAQIVGRSPATEAAAHTRG